VEGFNGVWLNGGFRFENGVYPNRSKWLTLLVKCLLTLMRVVPATLPRNRYNATNVDLRGIAKPIKTTLGDIGENIDNSGKISDINKLAPAIQSLSM
jgi:hypothetical protein